MKNLKAGDPFEIPSPMKEFTISGNVTDQSLINCRALINMSDIANIVETEDGCYIENKNGRAVKVSVSYDEIKKYYLGEE